MLSIHDREESHPQLRAYIVLISQHSSGSTIQKQPIGSQTTCSHLCCLVTQSWSPRWAVTEIHSAGSFRGILLLLWACMEWCWRDSQPYSDRGGFPCVLLGTRKLYDCKSNTALTLSSSPGILMKASLALKPAQPCNDFLEQKHL